MSFRQKIKQVFHRAPSGPSTPSKSGEPGENISATANSNSNINNHKTTTSSSSFPSFAIKRVKTRDREAEKREKREKKEQRKRDKSKPKIELYKPYEIPPSKYRGPRDEAHQQRLNAYTFNPGSSSGRLAMQTSSPELSPMATRVTPSRRQSVDSESRIQAVVEGLVEGDDGHGEFILPIFYLILLILSQPLSRLKLLIFDVVEPGHADIHGPLTQPGLPPQHHLFSHEPRFDESGSEPATMVDTDADSPSRSRLTVYTDRTAVVDLDEMDGHPDPHPQPFSYIKDDNGIIDHGTTPFSPEQLAEALNATRLNP